MKIEEKTRQVYLWGNTEETNFEQFIDCRIWSFICRKTTNKLLVVDNF